MHSYAWFEPKAPLNQVFSPFNSVFPAEMPHRIPGWKLNLLRNEISPFHVASRDSIFAIRHGSSD